MLYHKFHHHILLHDNNNISNRKRHLLHFLWSRSRSRRLAIHHRCHHHFHWWESSFLFSTTSSPTTPTASASAAASTATKPPPPQNNNYHYHPKKKKKDVVVALSGGVDSAVAAALLRDRLLGCVHMTNWNHHHDSAFHDAQSIVRQLQQQQPQQQQLHSHSQSQSHNNTNIPLKHVHWHAHYDHYVFRPLVHKIQQGHMPSPDLDCNKYVKFQMLRQYIQDTFRFPPTIGVMMEGNTETDADANDCHDDPCPPIWLATGHYARLWHVVRPRNPPPPPYPDLPIPVALQSTFQRFPKLLQWIQQQQLQSKPQPQQPSKPQQPQRSRSSHHHHCLTLLYQAVDTRKDQTYFLASCSSDQFHNVLFPLGDLYKQQQNNPPPPHTHPSLNNNNNSNNNNNNNNNRDPPPRSVRQIARDLRLSVAHKKDSVGICALSPLPRRGNNGNNNRNNRNNNKNQSRNRSRKNSSPFQATMLDELPLPTETTPPLRFVDIETRQIVSQVHPPPPQPHGHHPHPHHGDDGDGDCCNFAGLYTPGQGAKLGGCATKFYVVDVQVDTNTVYVCPGTHHPALYTDQLDLDYMHWMCGPTLEAALMEPMSMMPRQMPMQTTQSQQQNHNEAASESEFESFFLRVDCRIRHLDPLVPAVLTMLRPRPRLRHDTQFEPLNHPTTTTTTTSSSSSSATNTTTTTTNTNTTTWSLKFDRPIRGVTVGQMAVLYLGLVCLGGGPIKKRGRTLWEKEQMKMDSSRQIAGKHSNNNNHTDTAQSLFQFP